MKAVNLNLPHQPRKSLNSRVRSVPGPTGGWGGGGGGAIKQTRSVGFPFCSKDTISAIVSSQHKNVMPKRRDVDLIVLNFY